MTAEPPEQSCCRERTDAERSALDAIPAEGGAASVADRIAVGFAPGFAFGCPTVRAAPVEAIVGMLNAGEPAGVVCDEYGLLPDELVVVCWFAARWGVPNRPATALMPRKDWAGWLARYGEALSYGRYAEVPLPTEEDG